MATMTAVSRRAALTVKALLLFVTASALCAAQHSTEPDSAQTLFLDTATSEEKTGEYIFYTQSFKDRDNDRASYRGSVYGVVRNVKLDGCTMTAEVLIADSFSAVVGKTKIDHQQDTYIYRASLVLTRELINGSAVMQARPVQLARSTHSQCEGDGSCAFTWLRLQAKRRVIKEISTINDMVDFEGMVDHVLMPLSSPAAGKEWITRMQALADSRCP